MSPFLQMDRVQDFTHSLYDSSSDSAEETPFKSERDSQKLRRRSCRPVSLFFGGGGVTIVKMSVALASESDGDSSNL